MDGGEAGVTENDVYTVDGESLDVTRRELGKGVTAAAVGTATVAMTAGSAQAQPTQISGTVTDSDGAVGGATVVAVPHDNSLDPLATATASDGTYQFGQSDLHNGTNLYHVIARDGTQSSPRRGQENYPFIAAMGETAIPDSVVEQFDAREQFDSSDEGTTTSSWTGINGTTIGGTSPTVAGNSINGYRALDFSGVSAGLRGTLSQSYSEPYTVFIVAELQSDSAQQYLFDGDDSFNLICWNNSQEWAINTGSSTLSDGSDTSIQVFTLVADSSDALRLDGSEAVSGDAGSNALDGITVGAQNNDDNPWNGYVGFVEIHEGLPSNGLQTREQEIIDSWSGSGNESTGQQLLADGAWDGDSNPHVFYDATDDVTYFGAAAANGDVVLANYDHSSGSVTTNTVKSYGSESDHQYPAITIRDDGLVQVFYAAHLGSNTIYTRISDNARDISSFGSEFQLSDAVGDYPNVAKNGTNGIAFWRGDANKNIQYAETSDDGSSWTNGSEFYGVADSNLYPNVVSEPGSSIVHIAGEYLDLSAGSLVGYDYLYYAKIEISTGDVMNADGTTVGTLADTPFGEADLEKAYTESESGYEARVHSLELDTNGNPVIGFQRRDPATISNSDAGDHAVLWFDGTSWNTSVVASAGTAIRDGESAGIGVDPTDTNVVYAGQADSLDDADIYRYVSTDGKSTWTQDATVVEDANENIRPLVPSERQSDLRVLWMEGRYDALNDYDTEIRGSSI